MPRDWAVRPAERRDIEACVELALRAAAGEGSSATSDFWQGALTRDVDDADRQLVVGSIADEIVGYARAHLFQPEPPSAPDVAPNGYYLIGLYVRPDCRRAGLGAALTTARLQWIGGRAAEAWFFTDARNSVSIRLHERLGFEEVTRRFTFPGLSARGNVLFRARLAV
jgi:ribosomal protein S18 acetylase RimI-like enzyme